MTRAVQSDRLNALSRLMTTVHAHVEHGDRVPCVDPHIGHWWTSEDREALTDAATACERCPALAACSSYVGAYPEPSGVWAGLMPRSTPQRKASR